MPAKKKTPEYKIQGKTVSITATSRASVKVGDSFYTVEYREERAIPDSADINIEAERAALWDACNGECDAQIEDIVKTFKK